MAKHSKLPEPVNVDTAELERNWGIEVDPSLLHRALIHRSFAYEAGGIAHNERLEFLGDSVLSIVVAARLFEDHPDHSEADLSRMRAATVSQEPLAYVARRIHLGDFLYLGRGEDIHGGRHKDSILSDALEALIGATFLTHGFEKTRQIVLHQLADLLDRAVVRGQMQDWKTTLNEYARDHGHEQPVYQVTSTGPDHERSFTATVAFGEVGYEKSALATAEGTSKKHAENAAARAAIARLDPDYPME